MVTCPSKHAKGASWRSWSVGGREQRSIARLMQVVPLVSRAVLLPPIDEESEFGPLLSPCPLSTKCRTWKTQGSSCK